MVQSDQAVDKLWPNFLLSSPSQIFGLILPVFSMRVVCLCTFLHRFLPLQSHYSNSLSMTHPTRATRSPEHIWIGINRLIIIARMLRQSRVTQKRGGARTESGVGCHAG